MRLGLLRFSIICLFAVLGADIFWMQIVQGPDYARQSENNRIRLVPEEASRGTIYDRNGIPLVENKMGFDVVAIPQEIRLADQDRIFSKLGRLLSIDSEALADTFAYNFDSGFSPIMLAADVPRETALLVEQEMSDLPGVFVKTKALRAYPCAKAAAHVIGYVGKMRDEEYPQLKQYGYRMQDVIGRSGIEKSFDNVLRGKPGGMQIEVNSRGSIIRVLSYRPPVCGENVYTTLDSKLQLLVSECLGDTKGAVVVMEASSGEILALCSGPSFDPNVIISKKQSAAIREILNSSDAPMLDRAVNAYAPGSVFKIVTAYAGLLEKVITPQTAYFCPGHFTIGNSTRNCWLKSGHGSVTVVDALMVSCNVFFWEMGLKIGESRIAGHAREFGLGRKTDIELPGEVSGVVPDQGWKKNTLHQPWYGGDTVNFAIGQGYLLVTPVQALRMVAFVANGGYEVAPHLVKRAVPQREKKKKGLNPEVLDIILSGMYNVVNASEGTGQRAAVEGVRTFAKTGTAQAGGGSPHAWFLGFTEAGKRKICFVVFLEHGGHGGEQAADIARRIIQYYKGAAS
ncbi:MAG: penicillin-binding protein 2 [Candidatus Omnitrophica bacterium]|nr:penicillin-binding protein 2 [Candidatus Omnitrophota bacterium]